jgi:uncharacterized secreted protein with C-terminal beta-propeller domain
MKLHIIRHSILFILGVFAAMGCDRVDDLKNGNPNNPTPPDCPQGDCPPGGAGGGELPSLDPMSFSSDLLHLPDCSAVENAIEQKIIDNLNFEAADAKERFKNYLKYNRQIHGNSSNEVSGASDGSSEDMASSPSAAQSDSEAKSASSGPSTVSQTNTQVAGVDEADIVKTDGKHIYVINRNRFYVVKSWPADSLATLASVPFFEETITDMLLDESGQIIVIGNMHAAPLSGYWSSPSRTSVTVVDVKDPSKPSVSKRYTLPGSYHSVRRIGTSLRLILRNDSNFYQAHLNWQILNMFYTMDINEAEFNTRVDLELERNIAATKEKTLAYWLNQDQYKQLDGIKTSVIELPNMCSSVYVPAAPTALGLTSIVTLELSSGSVETSQLLTNADTVYANAESLYFTTNYNWWRQSAEQKDYTFVHKFDIRDPKTSVYLGSGAIEGHLLNQFSMDEFEGNLRVATTVTERRSIAEENQSPFWWRPFQTNVFNRVSVLSINGGKLQVIGETDQIAKDERIFSVRFNGKKGYVVTFRQVDPLFTLDLSVPTDPRVVGELKVDGVSNYIHMLDENHLLTVGRGEGWNTMRITIFDVTNPATPTEKHRLDLPGQSTQAQWDHKAFTFVRETGTLALPVAGYSNGFDNSTGWWNSYRSAVMVFKISADAGIKTLGELAVNDIYQGKNYGWSWWYQRAYVNRAIIADNFVYAVSQFGIRSADIGALEKPLSTGLFMNAAP